MAENLMPIGRFSRAVRLSVKALRHYDEQGLLRPALVDAQTGYRYYARSQARDAVMIAMLRSLDVPLATIRGALTSSPEALQRILSAESERLQSEHERRRAALRALERCARAATLAPYEIAVRHEPAVLVARLSGVTTAEGLIEDSTAWVFEVMDEVRRAGRPVLIPVLCVTEAPDDEGRIVVHAGARIEPPFPSLGRAAPHELPACTCAVTGHRGSYAELGLAHHALFAWAQERGHEPTGGVREVYLDDPAEVPEEELVTEVLLPIDGRGAEPTGF
jgi:DNA-binding transcriptional MerR regulator